VDHSLSVQPTRAGFIVIHLHQSSSPVFHHIMPVMQHSAAGHCQFAQIGHQSIQSFLIFSSQHSISTHSIKHIISNTSHQWALSVLHFCSTHSHSIHSWHHTGIVTCTCSPAQSTHSAMSGLQPIHPRFQLAFKHNLQAKARLHHFGTTTQARQFSITHIRLTTHSQAKNTKNLELVFKHTGAKQVPQTILNLFQTQAHWFLHTDYGTLRHPTDTPRTDVGG